MELRRRASQLLVSDQEEYEFHLADGERMLPISSSQYHRVSPCCQGGSRTPDLTGPSPLAFWVAVAIATCHHTELLIWRILILLGEF